MANLDGRPRGAAGRPHRRPGRDQAEPKVLVLGGVDLDLRLPFLHRLRAAGFGVLAVGTGDPRPFVDQQIPYAGYRLDRFVSPWSDVRSLGEIVALVRAHRPDIVHGFATKPSLLAPLAVARTGIGHAVRTINGMGYLFSSRSPLALALRPAYRSLQRHVAPRSAMTIFQNEQDRAYFQRHRLVDVRRSQVIRGSGVDLDGLDAQAPEPAAVERLRQELGLEGRRVVTLVARMIRHKGVPTLLAAAKRLAARHPDVVHLLVGPWKSEGPFAISAKSVRRHGPHVRALGPRTDVPALLALTDVFVLPTRYREGVPRVLLEAGAAGCAMVATRMPGCADVIRDGWNGLLVEPGDAAGLARALEQLLARPDLRRTMGERSRSFVRDHFALDLIVDDHARLYRRLIAGEIDDWALTGAVEDRAAIAPLRGRQTPAPGHVAG